MSRFASKSSSHLARKCSGVAIVVGALVALVGCGEEARDGDNPFGITPERRSVVLITVDTTRADRLEPYGATDVETPHMNRLALEGLRFDHAYSVAPITLVSHTSILTGLYPPQHGVRNNGTHYVPDELTSVAEILRDDGYRTAAFVSAAVLEKRYGLTQGFEVYDDDLSTGRERHPRTVPDRPAEATVDAANTWLDGLDGEDPFFLWIHFYDPHAAYSPPPPFRDRYRERLYDGEIAYMDAQIGRLLDHPRLRRNQDLVVSVLGDHGESLGEHGEQTHAILAYDSTLRVPWILRVSGGRPGLVVREPVSQVDFFPTLLDVLDFEIPEGLPGRSLLTGLEQGAAQRPTIYSETYLPYYTYGWAKIKVGRRGFYKFIDAPVPELYDLRRDPSELSNRYEQEPGTSHDLSRDLEELLAELGDPERETALELDSEAADKLRSLGYLSFRTVEQSDAERPDPKAMVGLHVRLERARRMMRDRLFDQAERELRAVLGRDPNNLAALVELAAVFDEQGKIDEGRQAVEQALSIDPGNVGLTLRLASIEAQAGELDQALQLADAALELDPRHLEAAIQKATFLQRQRQFDQAEAVLSAALEREPDHPRINTFYARMVELRQGELVAAEARLREVLERDPFMVQAYRLLGETLSRQHKGDEAAEQFRLGLERQPDDGDLHARLGLLLARQGGDSEAERHLSEAIRLSPVFRADLHSARGGWLAEHGRLEDALREYDRVLEVQPKHPGARNNRSVALYQMGRAEEAIAALEAVIADHPKHADAYNNLAAIGIHRRDWPAVERRSRQALELDDTMPSAWNNLAVALEEQDRLSAAEGAYDRALELAPDYWQARFNRGVLLRKSDRPAEAAQELETVLQERPGVPDIHLELGTLYAGPLDDPGRARDYWNAFLAAAPQHPRAEEIRQRIEDLRIPTGAR